MKQKKMKYTKAITLGIYYYKRSSDNKYDIKY